MIISFIYKHFHNYTYNLCIEIKSLYFLQAADLTKPVDKRVYKGTYPTCHDFNQCTVTNEGVSLLVGFSAGQIQLIDPIKKELSKLYNEEVSFNNFFFFCYCINTLI